MPFWRNSLSGVCTENNYEIDFTKVRAMAPIPSFCTAGSRTWGESITLSNPVKGVFKRGFEEDASWSIHELRP